MRFAVAHRGCGLLSVVVQMRKSDANAVAVHMGKIQIRN